MAQNKLYLLLGILAALVVVMGVYIWQQQREPEGVEIKIDQNGISVQGQ